MKRRKHKKSFVVVAVLILVVLAGILIYFEHPEIYMPLQYQQIVTEQAEKHHIDEALVYAVIYCESGFDSDAVSHAGACGLMQVMPQTAQELAGKYKIPYAMLNDLFDPTINIALGCSFLSELIGHFRELPTAIAAYNAGRARVKGWLAEPRYSSDGKTLREIPYEETKNYVRKVLAAYEKYQKILS